MEFNDERVQKLSTMDFMRQASKNGYLFYYQQIDLNSQEILDFNSAPYHRFTVAKKEEEFIRIVRASLNEKNLHSVAVRDDQTKNYLSFYQLAMIDGNPRPCILKRLKKIYQRYQPGWLSEVVVDFFLCQLCQMANDASNYRKFGAVECSDTMKIVNNQHTLQTFQLISQKCYHNDNFCDVMFFPLLENRHFTLYVIDNLKNQVISYDSMSCSRDNRQKLVRHGNSFFEFFRNGTTNRYWSKMPTVFDGQIHRVQQARCPQQKDSASCGVFCCLFAEQICFSEKEIQPDDNADALRYYVTLQHIIRSHIVDPELQRLFMAFIGTESAFSGHVRHFNLL